MTSAKFLMAITISSVLFATIVAQKVVLDLETTLVKDEFDDIADFSFSGGRIDFECQVDDCRAGGKVVIVSEEGEEVGKADCETKTVVPVPIDRYLPFGNYSCAYGGQISSETFVYDHRTCTAEDGPQDAAGKCAPGAGKVCVVTDRHPTGTCQAYEFKCGMYSGAWTALAGSRLCPFGYLSVCERVNVDVTLFDALLSRYYRNIQCDFPSQMLRLVYNGKTLHISEVFLPTRNSSVQLLASSWALAKSGTAVVRCAFKLRSRVEVLAGTGKFAWGTDLLFRVPDELFDLEVPRAKFVCNVTANGTLLASAWAIGVFLYPTAGTNCSIMSPDSSVKFISEGSIVLADGKTVECSGRAEVRTSFPYGLLTTQYKFTVSSNETIVTPRPKLDGEKSQLGYLGFLAVVFAGAGFAGLYFVHRRRQIVVTPAAGLSSGSIELDVFQRTSSPESEAQPSSDVGELFEDRPSTSAMEVEDELAETRCHVLRGFPKNPALRIVGDQSSLIAANLEAKEKLESWTYASYVTLVREIVENFLWRLPTFRDDELVEVACSHNPELRLLKSTAARVKNVALEDGLHLSLVRDYLNNELLFGLPPKTLEQVELLLRMAREHGIGQMVKLGISGAFVALNRLRTAAPNFKIGRFTVIEVRTIPRSDNSHDCDVTEIYFSDWTRIPSRLTIYNVDPVLSISIVRTSKADQDLTWRRLLDLFGVMLERQLAAPKARKAVAFMCGSGKIESATYAAMFIAFQVLHDHQAAPFEQVVGHVLRSRYGAWREVNEIRLLGQVYAYREFCCVAARHLRRA